MKVVIAGVKTLGAWEMKKNLEAMADGAEEPPYTESPSAVVIEAGDSPGCILVGNGDEFGNPVRINAMELKRALGLFL